MSTNVEVVIELNGNDIAVPITFKLVQEICKKVCDTNKLTKIIANGGAEITVDHVVGVLFYAAKHSGSALTYDQVGEAVMRRGGPLSCSVDMARIIAAMSQGVGSSDRGGAAGTQGEAGANKTS